MVRNGLVLALAFAVFAAVHSLTAGLGLKERLKNRFGGRIVEGWYRLGYNILSVVLLLPVLVLMVALPDEVLYRVDGPAAWLMRTVQVVGVVGLVIAASETDVWRFAGLSQALAYLRGDPLPLPSQPLVTGGMYRLVRHPLYFFSLLAIWPTPVMTISTLIFNVAATLYFIIGSRIEERRLLRAYGETYRSYRSRVSWLLPLPPFKRKIEEPV